jgi:hypothetical protein
MFIRDDIFLDTKWWLVIHVFAHITMDGVWRPKNVFFNISTKVGLMYLSVMQLDYFLPSK